MPRTTIISPIEEESKTETMDTHTLMHQLPGETILTLRTRARARTVELGLPVMLFDHAELLVERDHVCLDAGRRLAGWVYDSGAWRNVSLSYCAHCGAGGACVHQLAIMFADLLSQHSPPPEAHASVPGPAGGSGGPMPSARARSSGGGHPRVGRSHAGRRRCPRCGSFTRGGACHNPKCRKNR